MSHGRSKFIPPMLHTQFRFCTLTIDLRFYSVPWLRYVSYNYAELVLGYGFRILPTTTINLYLFSADSYNNNNNMLCNHVIDYEVEVTTVTDEKV